MRPRRGARPQPAKHLDEVACTDLTFSLIARSPEGEVCACDLVEVLDRSQPTISHHLKVLHEAGVLTKERRGVWIHYGIEREAISSVCDALGIACAVPAERSEPAVV